MSAIVFRLPGPNDPIDVALLVLNWNGAELMRRHLPAVQAAADAAPVPTRAYVIDNASEDDSHDVVRDFDGVEWLPMRDNLKLLAYNEAARQIDCQAFMVLNNDLSPPVETVEALWPILRDQPDVFAAGGEMQNEETLETESGPTTLRWEREWVIDPTGRPHGSDPVDVAYVSGGAGLFRRDAFLRIGGFWPLLPSMYWEDVELGVRAWLHGMRSVFVPGVVFPHESGATTKKSMSDFRRSAGVYRNRRLMHVSQLLDERDRREWLKGEVVRNLRKPWLWPAALTLLPRLPEARAQRRRLQAECGNVTVADLQRRWSEG